ncbi:hypothetical protein [Caballeronia sp. TF1N1]|uniref:hypothetical protein n=1 Tax=Caballeronia sp. TF1N1 TaxID=2878153 RepID=UPI001FD3BD66|nr:hypothetical protein [Caballeronia sp. TF1N1]
MEIKSRIAPWRRRGRSCGYEDPAHSRCGPEVNDDSESGSAHLREVGVDELVAERPDFFKERAQASKRARRRARVLAMLRVLLYFGWFMLGLVVIGSMPFLWLWGAAQRVAAVARVRWTRR